MGRGDHSEVIFESRTEVTRGRDSGQRQKRVRSPSNRTVLDEVKEHRESTGDVDCPLKVPGQTWSSEKAWAGSWASGPSVQSCWTCMGLAVGRGLPRLWLKGSLPLAPFPLLFGWGGGWFSVALTDSVQYHCHIVSFQTMRTRLGLFLCYLLWKLKVLPPFLPCFPQRLP